MGEIITKYIILFLRSPRNGPSVGGWDFRWGQSSGSRSKPWSGKFNTVVVVSWSWHGTVENLSVDSLGGLVSMDP